MNIKLWIGAGLLATVASLAPLAFSAGERIEKKVVIVNGSGPHHDFADKVSITDADSLAIGETRDYTSPSGKSFTLTRDAEDHWTLRGLGKEFGFGGAPEDLEIAGGAGQVSVNKRIIVLDGDSDGEEAEIHTIAGGGDGEKRVEVFVDRAGDGEPVVQKILVNGQEADADGQNVKIIVKKDGAEGAPHAIWIGKDGSHHEGLAGQGLMMIETEDIASSGGAPENATMVEITRESGSEGERRVEKRVFLFVSESEEN
ncbi:MAG: hypothetical protein SF066_15835 [Thermoanaerobaculia bacterium]|nr:hypothetical protein [Thermoanaerobaculia bacterium]